MNLKYPTSAQTLLYQIMRKIATDSSMFKIIINATKSIPKLKSRGNLFQYNFGTSYSNCHSMKGDTSRVVHYLKCMVITNYL